MGVLSDEEKKRIIEEEELRAKIRRKYEQKSTGIAAVLSTICPGLGQIYNGQIGKGAIFFFIILISLSLIVTGITFWIKGVPGKESAGIMSEKPVEITEEGIVIEEEEEKEEEEEEEKVPGLAVALIIAGIIGLGLDGSFAVKDAIKTAKRLNES